VITGPDGGAAAGHGRLRASHADREHVIDALKTAFADGRLDKDELDDRVGQALAARTCAELAPVTAGIPAGMPPRQPAHARNPAPGSRTVRDVAIGWGAGLSRAAPGAGRLPILPRRCLPPILGEIRTVLAAAAALSALPTPVLPGSGDGRPVLLIPGLDVGDYSLHRVRNYLRGCGHEVWSARIACNVSCSEAAVGRLLTRLAEIADRAGREVALVGHSRGGLYARVLSQRRPDLVSGVVTLGSPFRDQLAVHPLVWANVAALAVLGSLGMPGVLRYGCALSDCCADFRRDLAAPADPTVSYLSVYSQRDGIVDWRACLDPIGRNLEVPATHIGMILDPAVLAEIATAIRLAWEGAAARPA